jgi:hypothetical protein
MLTSWSGGQRRCTLLALRTCIDCGLTKPISEFTPIKGTPHTHTRCKACRARRAWETSHPGRSYDEWLEQKAGSDTQQKLLERTYSDCGVTRPLTEFTSSKPAGRAGMVGVASVARGERATAIRQIPSSVRSKRRA